MDGQRTCIILPPANDPQKPLFSSDKDARGIASRWWWRTTKKDRAQKSKDLPKGERFDLQTYFPFSRVLFPARDPSQPHKNGRRRRFKCGPSALCVSQRRSVTIDIFQNIQMRSLIGL